ncbi:TolC family protein [Desertivirga xinjiangensis]|uniref:TolC family protein n=1 Tax=Desertivirga xinjiangensis TaxID=539206 RepID=UPI002109D401|nr:TolC family protein [Pedobacter xinjiangensis]
MIFVIVFGSCGVSKDIIASSPIIEEYKKSFTYNRDTVATVAWQWKHFFPDSKLQKLIEKAVIENYDMQIALQKIEIARLQLRQSKLGQTPQLNAFVNNSTSIPSENSFNGYSINNFLGKSHIEDFSLDIFFSWEADIWGKINNRKKEALASYLQTQEAKKTIQADIVASVAVGYYNLVMLDAQLEIAKRNQALSEKTSHIISQQFKAAQVTHLAVEQAEAQRLQVKGIVPQIEKEITLQENVLNLLTGALPGRIERDKKLQDIVELGSLPTSIPSLLLSQRPDIKSLEYELNASNARVGIAKASLYPALNITATGGVNSLLASSWFNMPSSLFGTLASSISQPLLQGKRLRTNYEIAKIERENVILAFKRQILVAVSEVSGTLVEIEKLNEEASIKAQRVTNLQKAVGNANKLFISGLATYLEVITAQGNVLQSELELAGIKRNQLGAQVKLFKAIGGGWK